MLAEIIGELASETARGCGRVSCPHDRNERPVEEAQITPDREQRRRIVQLGKGARVQPLPEDEVASPEGVESQDLLFDVASADKARRTATTSRRKIGHGLERCSWRSEAGDQLAVGYRPDTGRTDQPEPVDQIITHSVFFPTFGSVPARRRAMLVLCFQTTRSANARSIGNRS